MSCVNGVGDALDCPTSEGKSAPQPSNTLKTPLHSIRSTASQGGTSKIDPMPGRFPNFREFLAKKQPSNKHAGKFVFVPYQNNKMLYSLYALREAYDNSGIFGCNYMFVYSSYVSVFFLHYFVFRFRNGYEIYISSCFYIIC